MTYMIRTELKNFIKERGNDVVKKITNFESEFQAYCAGRFTSNTDKADFFVLFEALREGIVGEILDAKKMDDALSRKLSSELQSTCGFTEFASNRAVDTWCYALELKEIPVEKREDNYSQEKIKSNGKNGYIVTESHLYGISNFRLWFGLLILIQLPNFYFFYKAGLLSSMKAILILIPFIFFVLYELYIWDLSNSDSASYKKNLLLTNIKYYLYILVVTFSFEALLSIAFMFGYDQVAELRFSVYLATGFLAFIVYKIFIFFSKSNRVKVTFGQYLELDGFRLVVKNASYEDCQRILNIKPEEKIETEDSIKKKQTGKRDVILGGILLFTTILVISNIPGSLKNGGGGAFVIAVGLLIRGIYNFAKSGSGTLNNSKLNQNTHSQSSSNTNYSQKSATNTNYAKPSESVKPQANPDANYSTQTNNQSEKKEETSKKEKTFEERLEELKRLQEKGIITQEEFQTRKAEILKEL